MSMRSAAAPAGDGSGLLKSALFWVGMLTASFLLGFLVLAPLGNLWYSSRSSAPKTDANQTSSNAPKPSPGPSTGAAAAATPKINVEPDQPVDISSDRSERDDLSVQQAQDPNASSPGAEPPRGGIRVTPDQVRDAYQDEPGSGTGLSVETEPAHASARDTAQDSSEADRPAPREESRVRRSEGRSRTEIDRSRNESEERPSRRSRRSRDRSRTTDDGEVQRGESIDR